mmetsp:Transcript_9634/g.18336  ORF Transcript_9634/g.18336 Transcript_9634/m.18336 type:complete len:86 (+) Transcript_9634:52-309(+)
MSFPLNYCNNSSLQQSINHSLLYSHLQNELKRTNPKSTVLSVDSLTDTPPDSIESWQACLQPRLLLLRCSSCHDFIVLPGGSEFL